ncbi:DUF6599 family protein [Gemmatimonadota bacterium]
MNRMAFLVIPLTALQLVGCSGYDSGFPAVDGWSQEGEVLTFDADNLWEYINGAAELFLDFGVESCRTTDLTAGEVMVTIEIYDMGSPLNAFGIYNLESSGRGKPFPDAVEALISPPYQALLVKGARYIKINTVEGELTETIGHALLEGIARALPGQTDYPAEFDLLPQVGRITGSEGYQAQGFLGLAELTHCVHAGYAAGDGETWQGFIIPTAISTADIWEALTERWESVEHRETTILSREIPYRGLVGVIRTDQGIIGVSSAVDMAQLLSRLDAFAF